jgi:DNA polymerase-3 subunit alpha
MTGIYISGHPLDEYAHLAIKGKGLISEIVKEDSPFQDGDKVTLLCTVTAMRTTLTRKNETMAYLQLEDISGTMEGLVFPRVYGSATPLLKEGAVCVVSGRISSREERGVQIICERLDSPLQYKSVPKKSRWWGLHLQLDAPDSPLEKQVLSLLATGRGKTPVYLKYKQTGKRVVLPENRFVNLTPALQKQLEQLLEKENVFVIS